jgi:hypothetical protein
MLIRRLLEHGCIDVFVVTGNRNGALREYPNQNFFVSRSRTLL